MLIPVVDVKQRPAQPCNRKRAYSLIRKGKATPFYRKGIFCIKLRKEIANISTESIVIGIDPGSKRTGITVLKKSGVILNIQIDTPSWIKDKVKTKRQYRRSRRGRNTPYRKLRSNRKIGGIPPSTKARWATHLRILGHLRRVIPITHVVIENIKAKTIKGARNWNKNFSPLEVGKKWFEDNVTLKLFKIEGYTTYQHRLQRGFTKVKDKLADIWEAHCVDSHSLCEMILGEVTPDKSFYKLSLLRFNRRELHQGFKKGGLRRNYGSTRSGELSRGTLIKHPKWGVTYLGGNSKGRVSLHNVESGKRLCQSVKVEDLVTLTRLAWRTAFLPSLKEGVSSRTIR